MNNITRETRKESYEAILETLGERQRHCLEGLEMYGEQTASELAYQLYTLGVTPNFNRNYTHPRLNELVDLGHVKIVGKKKCGFTNRNVAIYQLAI